MTELDLSKDHLASTMAEYSPLLCDECKEKLQALATPIAERLNKGKPPRARDTIRLMGSLCAHCQNNLVAHKMRRRIT